MGQLAVTAVDPEMPEPYRVQAARERDRLVAAITTGLRVRKWRLATFV